MQIKFQEICEIKVGQYHNGNKNIQLWHEDGPYATATVNIDGLAHDEVAIKDYSENEGMLAALLAAGIISQPVYEVKSGYVTIPVCKLLI